MKRLLTTKTKIKVNGVVETVPTSRALCLALIQKGMAGDVRAFSKIVEIVGPRWSTNSEQPRACHPVTSISSVTLCPQRRSHFWRSSASQP
jgi:hypothetical protein